MRQPLVHACPPRRLQRELSGHASGRIALDAQSLPIGQRLRDRLALRVVFGMQGGGEDAACVVVL
jgi:hypothetical protein